MLKTFRGWRDKQLPDGTVIWILPDGDTYVTTPGSALLFPALCAPTGDLPAPVVTSTERCGGYRTAMMPLRTTTRAQNRAHRIAVERRRNRQTRLTAEAAQIGPLPPDPGEAPPFSAPF